MTQRIRLPKPTYSIQHYPESFHPLLGKQPEKFYVRKGNNLVSGGYPTREAALDFATRIMGWKVS